MSSLLKEVLTVGHFLSALGGGLLHALYVRLKGVEAKVVAAAKIVEADVKKVL